ncbi:MAG: DUF488 family protein [Desulfobacterales bacterium]
MLYTIGYQKITVDQLIDILYGYGAEVLVDVRSKPYTSKPGFHRHELERLIPDKGVEYHWAGDRLGGFGEIKDDAVDELASLARQKTVCIMCMEADPDKCHRKTVIARRLSDRGIEAVHIMQTAQL